LNWKNKFGKSGDRASSSRRDTCRSKCKQKIGDRNCEKVILEGFGSWKKVLDWKKNQILQKWLLGR
jgi:hypothetical protein